MVTLMTLIGLAVGGEYTQECLYSFCHYQTQSITLQASRFQTNSELEQQCHCHCSFFVSLICCMGQVQKYTCTCVSLCLAVGLSVFISIFNCLSTPYLASRLLMQEEISLLLST